MFTFEVIAKLIWLTMFPFGFVFIACIAGYFAGAYKGGDE